MGRKQFFQKFAGVVTLEDVLPARLIKTLGFQSSRCLSVSHFIYVTFFIYEVRCVIWYHLYNFKNVKDTHGGVLLLVKLQAQPSN